MEERIERVGAMTVKCEILELSIQFSVYDWDEVKEDELIFMGFIKWDGCGEFESVDDACFHRCDRKGFIEVGSMYAWCWDYAKENLAGFEGDDD